MIGLAKRVAKRLNFFTFTRVNGRSVKIPRIYGLSTNVSEPWMVEVLKRLLPHTSGCFVDVGVNVGQTMIKVKAVDPERPYLGFEPNPTCVFFVQQLIQANGYTDCTVIPAGLFIRDTVLFLNFFSDSPIGSSASVIDNFRPSEKVDHRVPVPVFKYDSLGAEITDIRVGFAKIDVEGSELEVLTSMERVIERDRPPILIELLPVYTDNDSDRLRRQGGVEEFIRNKGYVIFRILKNSDNTFAKAILVEGFGIHGNLAECDYLLLPAGSGQINDLV